MGCVTMYRKDIRAMGFGARLGILLSAVPYVYLFIINY